MNKLKNSRIVGFDSLRFLAITLIIIYHCFPGVLPGGFVAVEIFFALSGFLIGSKLLREKTESRTQKKIRGFLKFVGERFLRLFPALFLCMIVTLSFAYFTDLDLLTSARENSLYAVTFSTNIASILNGTSYEAQLVPNLFNHTWFLALEFQVCVIIYIIFSTFFCLSDKKTKKYGKLALVCLAFGVLSFLLMGINGGKFELYDRAYFGPDTHIGAFFLGASLSALTASYKKIFQASEGKRRLFWWLWLILELVGIILTAPFFDYASPETFTFVLPIVSALSCLVILSILKLQKDKPLKIFRPFEYLGKISFYLYLFHWPLYILCRDVMKDSSPEFAPFVAIFASLVLSILADKIIMPFFFKKKRAIKFLLIIPFLVLPVMSLIKAPEVSSIEESLNQATEEPEQIEEESEKPKIDYSGITDLGVTLNNDIMPYFDKTVDFAKIYVAPKVTYSGGGYAAGYSGGGSGRAPYNTPDLSGASIAALRNASVMVLGDSVTLGAQANLSSMGYFVDALGSRNMFDAINLLSGYRSANGGILPQTIVISLVTNYSYFDAGTLESIINTAGVGNRFIFVTGFCGSCGLNSRDAQNNILKNFAGSHGNVQIADWATFVLGNLGAYTYADQTHLTPAGRAAYADLVRRTIGG